MEHQCTAPSLGLYFTAVITLYQVGLSKNGPDAGSNSDIIFGACRYITSRRLDILPKFKANTRTAKTTLFDCC